MAKICRQCGKEFKGPGRMYCSDECKLEHARTKSDKIYINKIKYNAVHSDKKSKNGKQRNGTSKTICWKCAKAYGKCSWAASFTPIEGWEVEHDPETRHADGRGKKSDGYTVLSCPEFEFDERFKR